MTLHLDDVTVTVPDGTETLTILDGLSLSVSDGDVVAVTGASGSGKSTLLAVAGLLRTADAGTIRIGDVDASTASAKDRTTLRRDAIGLVFQTSNLFPSLTALEQVELALHISGHLDDAGRQRSRELLEAVGLGSKLGNRPAQLSGGERQRVGIARALVRQPVVLLADEPTASLDPTRGREVMDLLVAQALERRIATVIVTHDREQLAGATRSLHLESGRLVDA